MLSFDSNDNDILCNKIKPSVSILPGLSLKTVSIKKIESDALYITCGVTQGSLPGPVLCQIYCNEMCISIENKLLLYTDDSIFLVCDTIPKIVAECLALELELYNNWLIDNKLSHHFD